MKQLVRVISTPAKAIEHISVGTIYQCIQSSPDLGLVKLQGLLEGSKSFWIGKERTQVIDPGACSIPSYATQKLQLEEDPELRGSDFDVDRADRANQGKMDWGLVDFKALEPMVEVLMFGAEKYSKSININDIAVYTSGRNNWKKGLPISETFGSLMRHLIAFKGGEDVDPESGKSHLGHAMCNLMFISYYLQNNPEKWDNRKE